MKTEEKYIDFAFAPYALADILYALDNSGIKDFAITKEDNGLHIRIPKSHLEHIMIAERVEENENH